MVSHGVGQFRKVLPWGPWNGAAQRHTYDAMFPKISQFVRVAVPDLTYTPPPCEREGRFL